MLASSSQLNDPKNLKKINNFTFRFLGNFYSLGWMCVFVWYSLEKHACIFVAKREIQAQ